jgi:hypothetical protein
MRKSVRSIAIAAATLAMASAFLSTTPAGGETKTPASVALADANWAALAAKPAAAFLVNGRSGYCLGVPGPGPGGGALILRGHCAGDSAQAWYVRASVTTSGSRSGTLTWYQFRNGLSGKCLGVHDGSTAGGAPLVQGDCGSTSDASQFWRLAPYGAAHELVNLKTRLCAGVRASSPGSGASVVQDGCSGSPAQAWLRAPR